VEEAITAIRSALAPEATAESRAAGIAACRAVLGALDPTTMPAVVAVAPPNAATVAQIVGALRGVPPDQLLDLAITRLRAALPAGTVVTPVAPFKFNLVPMPQGTRP